MAPTRTGRRHGVPARFKAIQPNDRFMTASFTPPRSRSPAADDTHSTPVVARPSSTLLLLREGRPGVEVLLVRRHANMTFMGGLWVFPGGALNAADSSDQALDLLGGRSCGGLPRMRALGGEPLPERQCLGLSMAACRETFEETGILLAHGDDGRPCNAETATRLQVQRQRVVAAPALFTELLRQAGLRPSLDQLLYWAHWITPSKSPKRFDTRFFVVAAPAEQPVLADTQETVEFAWLTPARAIDASCNEGMPISPPTLYNLLELRTALQQHGSLAGLLAGEANRPTPVVLPKMVRQDGRTTLIMPWSPDYAAAPGAGGPVDAQFPTLRHLPAHMPAS